MQYARGLTRRSCVAALGAVLEVAVVLPLRWVAFAVAVAVALATPTPPTPPWYPSLTDVATSFKKPAKGAPCPGTGG